MTDSERADLIGFTLTHSLLRNELPRLAAAMAGRPTSATEEHVVEDHVRLVMDHLVRHHQEEDDFHWPLLVSRAPRAARLLALLEAEHSEMDQLVDGVRDRDLPRRTRAAAMSHLSELVLAHLEEEDRSVVPLLAMHVTAAEQRESMARSRGKIPKLDELRVLAMMLALSRRLFTKDGFHVLGLLRTAELVLSKGTLHFFQDGKERAHIAFFIRRLYP